MPEPPGKQSSHRAGLNLGAASVYDLVNNVCERFVKRQKSNLRAPQGV